MRMPFGKQAAHDIGFQKGMARDCGIARRRRQLARCRGLRCWVFACSGPPPGQAPTAAP
ncbi:hypothetical protein BN2364_4184 [Alloalcanivorax xenomutans]|nr:hypothetical protein BN2364_4184 [Alloalcanivorax xenomutans]